MRLLSNAGAAVKTILPALLSSLFLATSAALATDPWRPLVHDPRKLLGTLSCASATCHGRNEPLRSLGTIERQEYLHFLGADPHAQAARRMSEPRFQEVLARLKPEAPAKEPADQPSLARQASIAAERCASCHDPLGLASNATHVPLGRGIGCESCHGAAHDWLAVHFEQGISRDRLRELGLIDTKQVLVRARVCASCHVGGEGRDVNHDLLAAGHPPLRFELASHQALIDRKHWNDAPRRTAEPNYEVQLWAAGRIASADAALTLLESRARPAGQIAPWPEFAESDCRACHQPLRPQTNGSRGALTWQSWNVALAPPVPALAALRFEMQRSLVPPKDQIAQLAAEARTALRQSVRLSASGQILTPDGVPLDAQGALQQLSVNQGPTNWETACQELAALLAAGPSTGGELQCVHRLAAGLRLDFPPLAEIEAELAAVRREMSENRRQP